MNVDLVKMCDMGGQYGLTRSVTNGLTNDHFNGCIKCKLEHMARRWSQGDLADRPRTREFGNMCNSMMPFSNEVAVDNRSSVKSCRGKYYLLRHGSRFYILQLPCCKSG